MIRFMKFNANNNVKVKLTEDGKKILAAYHGGEIPQWYYDNYVDSRGWWTFQFHVLANIFGGHLWNGNPKQPFETNMLIGMGR